MGGCSDQWKGGEVEPEGVGGEKCWLAGGSPSEGRNPLEWAGRIDQKLATVETRGVPWRSPWGDGAVPEVVASVEGLGDPGEAGADVLAPSDPQLDAPWTRCSWTWSATAMRMSWRSQPRAALRPRPRSRSPNPPCRPRPGTTATVTAKGRTQSRVEPLGSWSGGGGGCCWILGRHRRFQRTRRRCSRVPGTVSAEGLGLGVLRIGL